MGLVNITAIIGEGLVMKPIYPNWPIYVGWSKRLNCRGIQAARAIKADEVIEVCPVIIMEHSTQNGHSKQRPTNTLLDNYYYDWNQKKWCFALGYGALYNHSYAPNAVYSFDYINKLIKYIALTDIAKDEEITINYNYIPTDQTPIDDWFGEYFGRKIV